VTVEPRNSVTADLLAAAFVDVQLKGRVGRRAYLDVVPHGKDAAYDVDAAGAPGPAHTYWKGFARGTAVGLVLEHRSASPP
jgi:hypothetical protein